MKMIGLRDAKQALSECVDAAQRESIIITRHGKPAALLVGVQSDDLETVLLKADRKFWELAEERLQPGAQEYSLAEIRSEVERRAGAARTGRRRTGSPGRRRPTRA
jgi:prevent-host-death family protein